MSAGRIVLLVFGILFVLAAFGMLIGGGVILAFDNSFKDDDGFYSTAFEPFEADSSAIITQSAKIKMDEWYTGNRNPITIRIEAYSDIPEKDVFIGIAESSDLRDYLSGVTHDEVTGLSYYPFEVELRHRAGTEQPAAPEDETFWVASATGPDTQVLEWDVTSGNYSVVLMNSDASSPISAHVSLGAEIPQFLSAIGWGILIGGIVLIVLGGVMIFFAARGW